MEKALKHPQKKEVIKEVLRVNTAQLQSYVVRNATPGGVFKKGYSVPWTNKNINIKMEDLRGIVEASTAYAGYVEEGTRFMEAEPFMKPALKKVEPQFQKDMRRVVFEK